MTLKLIAGEAGLWRDGPPAAGGVHAMIVGISAYPHLSGGPQPAADTGGMGQLFVSAMTAFRLFEWLQGADAFAGAPIRSCRLLLSPAPGELAALATMPPGGFAPADMTTLRAAIAGWGRDLFAARHAAQNVALLFFSGHGVENVARPALLARDVLDPDTPGSGNNALSFRNLQESVSTYGITQGLFLLDACRNAPDLARRLNIVGQDVLEPEPYPVRSPDALMWLQATRAGASAYQLSTGPATLFGQALLKGLDGPPPNHDPYNRQTSPWTLPFENLASHTKDGVTELLKKISASVLQPVQAGGDPYDPDMIVSTKSPVSPPVASPPVGEERGDGAEDTDGADRITGVDDALFHAGVDGPADAIDFGIGGSPKSAVAPGPGSPPLAGWRRRAFELRADDFLLGQKARVLPPAEVRRLDDFNTMHEVFGRETLTFPWTGSISLTDLDGDACPVEAIRLLDARSRDPSDGTAAWLDILFDPQQLASDAPHVLQVGGGERPSAAVTLPVTAFPIRLDVGLGHDGIVETFSARLAPPELLPQRPAILDSLWELQRQDLLGDRAGAKAALDTLTPQLATEPLDDALLGMVATSYYLRLGALDQVPDRIWRLMESAEHAFSDLAVLTGERGRQAGMRDLYPAASSPVPVFADIFALAARRTEAELAHLSPTERSVSEAVALLTDWMTPGGLFTSYYSSAGENLSTLIVGERAMVAG